MGEVRFYNECVQAFPFDTNVEIGPWTVLRYIDICYQKFIEILISPVLWEETIARGLFLVYLIKIGLDEPFKRMKLNQSNFISNIFFSLILVQNFLKIKSPEQIAYALVYPAGAVLVGYMLAMILKKQIRCFGQ